MCRFLALHVVTLIDSLIHHFEADQVHRVRSQLAGSYQLDRLLGFAPALQVFWGGVDCSEMGSGMQ